MGYQNSVNSILQTLTGIQIGQRAIAKVGEISKAQEAQNANVEAIKKHLTGVDKFKEAAKTGDFSNVYPADVVGVVLTHPDVIKGMTKEQQNQLNKVAKTWGRKGNDQVAEAYEKMLASSDDYKDFTTFPGAPGYLRDPKEDTSKKLLPELYTMEDLLDRENFRGYMEGAAEALKNRDQLKGLEEGLGGQPQSQPRTLKGLGKKARLEKHEYGNKK